ncbi:MAG: response regulator [Deltaproteobacteria bacterium]|nr:response regulator [Deltaproteobacteria bacterium]
MGLFSKLKAMKLLLIDDDEWIRDSLSIFFEGEGCHLLALETAEDGLEELKSQDYDIIIADYRLPGMDGLEFLKRSQETNPNAMRVLITAYGNSEIFTKAYKLGVQDCINKPFTIETIEESLSRLMEAGEKKN